ncbi:G-type lectin S-receptor-like serine/threonine-protein kinase At4g03230 isoform X1 [Tripterygium wilfordii]|uniref:G-type lectin S-receptor-like serine/threonine-protein kinase At4g03230 isoform X1 n=1 Tax=Tripterygium wilfordii TaxID=458696 RepID=UPI0018F7ED39|nr:G-type lectin S-receptor-like serine/threonine-protein kinase At4g03230 isoform X1 [Tripterygium wilfordii]
MITCRELKKRIRFRQSVNRMLSAAFFWYTFFSSLSLLCFARDTITIDSQLIDDQRGETLVSDGERFELGFFTLNGRRYVGIWYYKSNPRVVVWVANRDNPLLESDGRFAIDDGNLKVLDSTRNLHWSTDLGSSSFTLRLAELKDSGNLVLSDDNQAVRLWQSFEHPTDTFLSGMKMNKNLTLTSWRSQDDPAPGNFTFKMDEDKDNQFVIKKRFICYWISSESGKVFSSDEKIPYSVAYLLSNFSNSIDPKRYKAYNNLTISSSMDHDSSGSLVMAITGDIQFWSWDVNKKSGTLIWWEPRDRCSVFNSCGNFASCNSNNAIACKCLPGFEPSFPERWNTGDFSGGCIRKSTSVICGKKDTFLNLTTMKVKDPDSTYPAMSETDCRTQCLDYCVCQAYSYNEAKSQRATTSTSSTCWFWTASVYNLQESSPKDGHNLSVRVTIPDLELTTRNCDPCGVNIIPYPLSSQPNCGDPSYFSFFCNDSTGQLSFKAPNGTYNVTRINLDTRTFFIQANDAYSISGILDLNLSFPFNLTGRSNADNSSHGTKELEITWNPPAEPTCNSIIDCHDWPHTTCSLKVEGQRRCLCETDYQWDPLVLNCTQENRDNAPQNVALHLYDTERTVKDWINSFQFEEEDKKGIDVPFLNLESILIATDNFSDANKLGQGGFGPVYKGSFPGGQEIAVKRLSSVSGQGLVEFKNEVVLIARLQHRNLVRLLGYSIGGDEKLLVYEYMPNKSLDYFLFGNNCNMTLDWNLRFSIILGIARGLVYLHQDSRLRIIHRDLKTSNILLDEEMNPKISDFGLARIFEGRQTEGNTSRVVGTYGYMSPEYALDGCFSVKSDVFSFGVVILEIISGRRNTKRYDFEQAPTLLGYAWSLYREDQALGFMDKPLQESCKTNEFLKCINVGLLCVQEDPADRPTMSNVITMLSSEAGTLPTPKQPAFITRRGSTTGSSSSKPETNNESTNTLVEGR